MEESLTLMFGHKSALHLTFALKLASAPIDDSIENWWTFRWSLAIWFCWAKPLFVVNRASFASCEIVVLHYCVSRQETRIRKEVNINALIEPLRESSWTSTFVDSDSLSFVCFLFRVLHIHTLLACVTTGKLSTIIYYKLCKNKKRSEKKRKKNRTVSNSLFSYTNITVNVIAFTMSNKMTNDCW